MSIKIEWKQQEQEQEQKEEEEEAVGKWKKILVYFYQI